MAAAPAPLATSTAAAPPPTTPGGAPSDRQTSRQPSRTACSLFLPPPVYRLPPGVLSMAPGRPAASITELLGGQIYWTPTRDLACGGAVTPHSILAGGDERAAGPPRPRQSVAGGQRGPD